MKNHKLNEQLLSELKQYLAGHDSVKNEIKECLRSVKVHLRSVVAIDIKSHPKLLFIYNEFQKLKDVVDQHQGRKEQLLLPFFGELVNDDEAGQTINGKVVNSFLKVFSTENDRIVSAILAIDEATGNYKTEVAFPPTLKKAFDELRTLSKVMQKMCKEENQLFHKLQQSHKESFISKIRRT